MSALAKTLIFSLVLTLLFTLVANILPQVEGEAPRDIVVEIGSLTPEAFARFGEKLFHGKGTCSLCHNNLGRAPDILADNIVRTAEARLTDPNYRGKATDAAGYLRESMRQPSLFVVSGFGQKGSNGTRSPMPNVAKAPIELSDIETSAVIAFLEAKDGNPITVELPRVEADSAGAGDSDAEAPAAQTVEAAIAKFGCQACHAVMGSEADVGPDLTAVGARLSRSQVRQSIVDPHAVVAEGYDDFMPDDFAEQMLVSELDLLVDFLAGEGADKQ